ncbi:peptide ABC transporter substrate-binding protein [Listeria booriae]|uniref:Peptide ABC transporter substrate-binding protein n=2 Tax=Listeria booriae TaxID=1552123 RepID=A0A099VWH1_9LIST|nr:peptide ABC transporter substrate-binding protein [Listeria booriae]KGL37889.1 peptide ABC transporter substrate-binding protein [Listeria booriae]MBC1907317.1 peptide ABC transporter substrate-binding protein [Listeria booriae]STY45884.1 Stage 0 sporulation protein KA [Listeria booriae]
MILRKKMLAVLMLLGLLLLAACQSKDAVNETKKAETSTIHLMETGEIPGVNPTTADNSVSFRAINQIYEGLYRLDKDGKPELAMAAAEPEEKNGGKTLIFKIRDDANWSNGTPVTAADFEYAWKKVVDPKSAAAYGPQMEEIVKNATPILNGKMDPDQLGVKALDDKTLQVDLENPVPIFKDLLTTGTFFPQNQAFIEKQGDRYALSSDNLISNGPFKLENWDATKKTWDYVKNNKYWEKKNVKADKINVQVVKDTNQAINLYTTDKLDHIELDGEFVNKYKDEPEFHKTFTGRSVYLKMNQGKDGQKTDLANLNIRRALAMSIDKQTMVDQLLANGSSALNGNVPAKIMFDPETNEDFRTQNGDLLSYNPTEAKKYWEAGLKEIGKKDLTIALTAGDSSLQKQQTEFMQDQLQKNLPGLQINIKTVTQKASFTADVTQDYEMLLGGWSGDYSDPLTYLNLFLTDSPGNHTGFSNPEYDKLVLGAKGSLSNDPEKRWQALLKAEQILLKDNAALVPLYQGGRAYMQRDALKDYTMYPIGSENYKWMSKSK